MSLKVTKKSRGKIRMSKYSRKISNKPKFVLSTENDTEFDIAEIIYYIFTS